MSKQRKDTRTPDEKLTDRVRNMMQELHVRREVIRKKVRLSRHDFSSTFCVEVRDKLFPMSPATRGEIADLGDSSCVPSDLHVQSYCPRTVMNEMAMMVILKRMLEILQEEQAQHDAIVLTTNRSHLSAMG